MFRAPGLRFQASYLKELPVSASWLPGTTVTSDFANDLNCSLGFGASYEDRVVTPVTLHDCFGMCEADSECDAVRVDWWSVPRNWSSCEVGCVLLGGIDSDKCIVQKPVLQAAHSVRYSTFAREAPDKAQLVVAVVALVGYFPVVRYSGNGWTTSIAPWPGSSGGKLSSLLGAIRGQAALALPSLRIRIGVTSDESGVTSTILSYYAVLRYDALGSGEVALAVVNLGPDRGNVTLELNQLPPQLQGQQPMDLMCLGCASPAPLTQQYPVVVDGYGYTVFGGMKLPKWVSRGYIFNCKAKYAPPPSTSVIPLASCLVTCLRDDHCDAVSVEWAQKRSWPRPAEMSWFSNMVTCTLLGGVDLTSCEKDVTESHSTLTQVQ